MNRSIFKENENKKSESFQKNDLLNDLLAELKTLLLPIQRKKEAEFTENTWPAGLIIGNPRSGTTLFLQWLASLGNFAYPSNFLARFAYAPYLGALLQKMVFDKAYDFHNEFADINPVVNFDSNLGKSEGALSTNEFQHFFRNYMHNFDPEFLDEEAIGRVDFEGIKRGLASIEYCFGKPFFTKATMLQYNINDLYSTMPNPLFIYLTREPIFMMQSILLSREKYYGDKNIWWSVKPREYTFLKDMDIYHQIAGQVYFTDASITAALKEIPADKKLIVAYEEFCRSPQNYFDTIKDIYDRSGYKITSTYDGPDAFNASNRIVIEKSTIDKLEKAYDFFISGHSQIDNQ